MKIFSKLVFVFAALVFSSAVSAATCKIGADPENLSRQPLAGEERFVTLSVMTVTVGSGSGKKTTCDLPKGSPVWVDSKTKKFIWVENCGNTVYSENFAPEKISAGTSVVQGVHAGTVIQTVCDAKCEAKKVCDQAAGTLDKMNEQGEWICQLPQQKVRLIQSVEVAGTVQYQWKGWTDSGLFIPGATPTVNVGKPTSSVNGVACAAGTCKSGPVANFVAEIKAEFCGIRTSDGRLFKIGHNTTSDKFVRVVDWSSGSAGKFMIVNGVTSNDCDKVQNFIEKKLWTEMTKEFSLPNACTVQQKIIAQSNKVTQ